MNGSSAIAARYKAELPSILTMLAILVVLYFYPGVHPVLLGGMAACVLGAPLFPHRYSWVATLIGFGGLAALAYFYFGSTQMGIALAAIGAILAATSFFSKGRV